MKKFKEITEQYREKGRFHPVKPHSVHNVAGATPRKDSDSANVKLKEGEFKKEWSKTGKEGTHRETGEKTYEYHELDSDGKPTGNREYRNAQGKSMGESVEQIDEISKKTLGSYVTKAASSLSQASASSTHKRTKASADYDDNIRRGMKKKDADAHLNRGYDSAKPDIQKVLNRVQGIKKAASRLSKEEVEQIDEKNVPTSPEKWAQAKAQAKSKFDVYPSAYANGWAAKKYKEMGGGWKSVSEAVKDKFDIGEYDQEGDMAKSDLRSIIANAQKLHDMIEDADNLPEWCQNKITLAEDYISTVANYMSAEMSEETVVEGAFKRIATDKEEDERLANQKPPFDPDPPKKKSVIAGKHGVGYSTARHLARMAMQKQAEKYKPVRESLEESRKTEIVKEILKKKKAKSEDAFQTEPELSSTLTKV